MAMVVVERTAWIAEPSAFGQVTAVWSFTVASEYLPEVTTAWPPSELCPVGLPVPVGRQPRAARDFIPVLG